MRAPVVCQGCSFSITGNQVKRTVSRRALRFRSRGAESTLAERFAQGDIEEKEYRARLEVLRANRFPAQPDNS